MQSHSKAKRKSFVSTNDQFVSQIVSQGSIIEDHQSNSSNVNIVTSRNDDGIITGNGNTFGTLETGTQNISMVEPKMSITPRGPSIRYPKGSEKKKSGSVFFAERSTHVPTFKH